MKLKIFIFVFLPIVLNGCFAYDNTITWQDSSKVILHIPGERFKKDTSYLNIRFELDRANRQLVLPLVFCEIRKIKPFYHPTIGISSMDASIVKFFDLTVDITTLNGDSIFRENYLDTVSLNIFDIEGYFDGERYKYNANQYSFKKDLIPKLKKMKDSILINYSLKTIDTLGIVSEIEKQNVSFIRTKYRRFGSFF
jgi:hypothetical protein